MVRSQRRKGFHPRDVVAGRRQRVLLQFLKQGNLEAEYQTTSKFVKIIKFHKSWIIMNHHESSWIISDHVVKRFTKMSTEVVERWWLHDKSKVGWCRGHFTPVWQCQWDSQRFILFISFISLLFNVPVAVHCIYIYILHYIITILHIWDIYIYIFILDMYMEYNIYNIW